MSHSATEKASRIRLLIIDVDGVLTDGGLVFDNQGEEYKRFSSLDGHGIRMLLDNAFEVAVITGRQSGIVHHRMLELGVTRVYQGNRDKLPVFERLLADTGLAADEIAYIGDDLPDLAVMARVGLSVAVENAHGFVKQHCDFVTTHPGGYGAVREVCDFLLQAHGLLEDVQQAYLR